MADRMLDQEGASCEEGGRRRRALLPARTNSGTRIMTCQDNREKAAQADAMSQQGVCTSQAAGPGAQEESGQLSESASAAARTPARAFFFSFFAARLFKSRAARRAGSVSFVLAIVLCVCVALFY